MSSGWNLGNKLIGGITNFVGLTDTDAAQRGADEYTSGVNTAGDQLHSDLEPLYDTYKSAMDNGYSLGENLDRYSGRMNQNNADIGATYQDTQKEADKALTSENIQSYMNPYSQSKANAAAQAMAGKAGGSLQSSATNQNMYDAAADSYAKDWNTATQTAQNNYQNQYSANNQALNGLGMEASNYNSQLNAEMTPFQQYQNLLTSEASQKYAGNVAAAQAAGEAAGTNQGWFSSLLGSTFLGGGQK